MVLFVHWSRNIEWYLSIHNQLLTLNSIIFQDGSCLFDASLRLKFSCWELQDHFLHEYIKFWLINSYTESLIKHNFSYELQRYSELHIKLMFGNTTPM